MTCTRACIGDLGEAALVVMRSGGLVWIPAPRRQVGARAAARQRRHRRRFGLGYAGRMAHAKARVPSGPVDGIVAAFARVADRTHRSARLQEERDLIVRFAAIRASLSALMRPVLRSVYSHRQVRAPSSILIV